MSRYASTALSCFFGAGASGAVVARRLSEERGIRVLLLEAGKSDWGNFLVSNPITWGLLQAPSSPENWNFDLAEQQNSLFDMGRTMKYPGGKILGGSTSINGMVYFRGSPHDYDSWEDQGAKGWNSRNIEPIFRKIENAIDDGISQEVGRGGLLNLTFSDRSPMSEKLIAAASELGIKETHHFEDLEGISLNVATRQYGLRQTSSSSFLRPGYEKRKNNLHVVTEALVTKILFDSGSNGKPRARGVRYIKDGERKTVKATKEVIVSAGAIKTPQLLMLSGIGPRRHLQEMGIDVVKDLPGVGSNSQDHFGNIVYYGLDDPRYASPIGRPESTEEYVLHGTGYHTAVWGGDMVHHHRTKYFGTDVSLSNEKRPYPSIAMYFLPTALPIPFKTTAKHRFHVATVMTQQHPKSTGVIRLKSKNPLHQPFIDPKYFSEDDDMKVLIEGYRRLEEFEMTDAMKEIGYTMITPDFCNGAMNNKPPRCYKSY